MLKSELLVEIQKRHKNLDIIDIEKIFNIFIKKITTSLKDGHNVEIRGFGTISRKDNKEKFVRNPKTNEKLFKKKSYKLHFKIGKTLHKKFNSNLSND